MRLHGRVSTKVAEDVLIGRTVISLFLIGCAVISLAVLSIFGSSGIDVLFLIVKFLFYFVALWVAIKFTKIAFYAVKKMIRDV